MSTETAKTSAFRHRKSAEKSPPVAKAKQIKVRLARVARGTIYSSQSTVEFLQMYKAAPMERIDIIKGGIPARTVTIMADRMRVSKKHFMEVLGLASATIDRKAKANQSLSAEEGSRLLGMSRLVGQVEAIVSESGDMTGFDAAQWVADWLERPVPALGGKRPAEFMDTAEGQIMVTNLVAQMQSGAYA